MKTTTSTCKLCNQQFTHYKTQPAKYCKECLKKHTTKQCACCQKIFERKTKEKLDSFLEQTLCQECRQAPPRSDLEQRLFKEIVLGHLTTFSNITPAQEVLEEAICESCALMRLYSLHTLLIPFNDGKKLEDRPPHTQEYLKDILRRIRNINNLLNRSAFQQLQKRKIKTIAKINIKIEEPTDEELKQIQYEERQATRASR